MGSYLNPGNEKFLQCLNSEIYIDKTGLIKYCSRVMNSLQKYICMSRPRRFGKSVTADMLAAYYSRGCDSSELFAGYEIAEDEDHARNLNQYNVLFLNMQEFVSQSSSMMEMLQLLKKTLLWDLIGEYADLRYFDETNLTRTMQDIFSQTKIPFYWNQTETFEALRCYIDMNFEGLKDAILKMMNGRNGVAVDVRSFTNDMVTFHSKDDVLTLLVHLGYLGYRSDTEEVFIPNEEILNEYITSISNSDWGEVSKALKNSRTALDAIWNRDETVVARAVEEAHFESPYLQYNDENALSYTISLAFYVARNYYTVIKELPAGKGRADIVYLPRKQSADKPALLVELKWNKTAESAIDQIKEKCYPKALEDHRGNLLLVGITYDEKTKEHQCKIERDSIDR